MHRCSGQCCGPPQHLELRPNSPQAAGRSFMSGWVASLLASKLQLQTPLRTAFSLPGGRGGGNAPVGPNLQVHASQALGHCSRCVLRMRRLYSHSAAHL